MRRRPGPSGQQAERPQNAREPDAILGSVLTAESRLWINITTLIERASLPVSTGMSHGAASRRLFDALQRAQPGGYAAWIDTGEEQVLSVSPELFFDWRNRRLLARLMKGTAARGATDAEDDALAKALCASAKERAENVMIVDLLRNDMSRVSEPFSARGRLSRPENISGLVAFIASDRSLFLTGQTIGASGGFATI
jgi:hypothetical protein